MKSKLSRDTHDFPMFAIFFLLFCTVYLYFWLTGQGVVMDRSVYSDFVFMEAMAQFGYVSKEGKSHIFHYFLCFVSGNHIPSLLQAFVFMWLTFSFL